MKKSIAIISLFLMLQASGGRFEMWSEVGRGVVLRIWWSGLN